jgi:hypothetical protein
VDREQQSSQSGSTRTTPPKSGESKAKPKASASRAKGSGGENPAGTTAPDIMSRLPKTRPQRASQRRRTTSGDAPAKARATRGAAQAATASRKPATAKRPASTSQRRDAATPAPAARPATSGPQSQAPGLPRLAIDGAAEAVKLPLKVSGRLTLRALDAVARGLRRR